MSPIELLILVLGLPVLGCAAYLFLLAVAAKPPKPSAAQGSGRPPKLRFDFVVPAHDEEAGIEATIKSLAAVDYPEELRRILVVADNCTDATATVAERAGAIVLRRDEPDRRGKGYALALAFERSRKDGFADVAVVIDADSVVSPNLLRAFAERFEAGAAVVQADYTVRNPQASWRTRLLLIALTLFHVLRSLARERLGLSAGLRGNGMGFSTEILGRVPYGAFSVVEDVEYGIDLGEAGHRVRFVHEAKVYGDMVPGERASGAQRRRWEGGRATIARSRGIKLLARGLAKRDPLLFDLAMDVLVPPLTQLVLGATLGSAAAILACWALELPVFPAAAPWLLSVSFIAVYVLRGWALSGAGLRGLIDLCWAPVYILWKVGLLLKRSTEKKGEWVRTARESGDGEGQAFPRGGAGSSKPG